MKEERGLQQAACRHTCPRGTEWEGCELIGSLQSPMDCRLTTPKNKWGERPLGAARDVAMLRWLVKTLAGLPGTDRESKGPFRVPTEKEPQFPP